MTDPTAVSRMLWRKIKVLRDVVKGARYTLEGKQQEVRAIRNRKKWVVVDQERGLEMIVGEYEKTTNSNSLGFVSPLDKKMD